MLFQWFLSLPSSGFSLVRLSYISSKKKKRPWRSLTTSKDLFKKKKDRRVKTLWGAKAKQRLIWVSVQHAFLTARSQVKVNTHTANTHTDQAFKWLQTYAAFIPNHKWYYRYCCTWASYNPCLYTYILHCPDTHMQLLLCAHRRCSTLS